MAVIHEQIMYEKVRSETITGLVGSMLFAILTGLSSFLVIPLPFTPIPITAQTLVVLLSGIFLGRVYGPLSQVIYITLGVIGIPWFANQSAGIEILLGATGGYLVGFIISSFIIGYITDMSQQTRTLEVILFSLTISTIVVYITGILGLILVAGLQFWSALQLGFFPFLPGDLFKILSAMLIARLYLPQENTSVDTNYTRKKQLILVGTALISSIFLFSFIIYLLTAGNVPPVNLPLFSLMVSLVVLPAILIAYNYISE